MEGHTLCYIYQLCLVVCVCMYVYIYIYIFKTGYLALYLKYSYLQYFNVGCLEVAKV